MQTGEGGQKVYTSNYKISKSGDTMYSTVTTVNPTVLYICKWLRE